MILLSADIQSGKAALFSFPRNLCTATDGSCATGATRLVIGVSGAPNTTTVPLGSITFCPTSDGSPTQSYPVTDQPTRLS